MAVSWFFIPIVGALIGWGTNLIAVKMLFRPKMPMGLGPFKIQGVIPSRHKALARDVAHTFEQELLSGEELVSKFEDIDLSVDAKGLLDERLDSYLAAVKGKIPMASMFLSPDLEEQLKSLAFDELIQVIPELKSRIKDKLLEEYDLKRVLEEKIQAFELEKLEAIAMKVASKELKSIELLGGLIGFIIGLGQLFILFLDRAICI